MKRKPDHLFWSTGERAPGGDGASELEYQASHRWGETWSSTRCGKKISPYLVPWMILPEDVKEQTGIRFGICRNCLQNGVRIGEKDSPKKGKRA